MTSITAPVPALLTKKEKSTLAYEDVTAGKNPTHPTDTDYMGSYNMWKEVSSTIKGLIAGK